MVKWFSKPESHARAALHRPTASVGPATLRIDHDPGVWILGPDAETDPDTWHTEVKEAAVTDLAVTDSDVIDRIDHALDDVARVPSNAPRIGALRLPKPKEIGPQVTFTVGDTATLTEALGTDPDLWIAYTDVRNGEDEPEQPLDVADSDGWLIRLRMIDLDGSCQGLLRARRDGEPTVVATAWIPHASSGAAVSDVIDLILGTTPDTA